MTSKQSDRDKAKSDPLGQSDAAGVLDAALSSHQATIEAMVHDSGTLILAIAARICDCFNGGGKLLIAGCGGSAADAQHIAGEMVNRFRFDRQGLPAIALTTDSSVLTCVANDSSFERVFARQVETLALPGDTVLAISTSGRSTVVLRALEAARDRDATTLGFTGSSGAKYMEPICDLLLVAPTEDTPRIQECHEFAYHAICELVESTLFSDTAASPMTRP